MAARKTERSSQFYDLLNDRWKAAHDLSARGRRQLQAIDTRLLHRYERTLSPLVIDMSGFTRLTLRHGILHYLSLIRQMVKQVEPEIRHHRGRIVKQEADNVYAAFPNTALALAAAIKVRETLHAANLDDHKAFEIYVSMGVGHGPVLDLGYDMWGAEFNLACKLGEDVADRDEILLTEAARADLLAQGLRGYRFSRLPVILGSLELTAYKLKGRTGKRPRKMAALLTAPASRAKSTRE